MEHSEQGEHSAQIEPPKAHVQPKPTAPFVTGIKRDKIVLALAAGESAHSIADNNGHSERTVAAIRDTEQQKITEAKEKLARQSNLIARLAGRRITENLRANTLPVHLLPTTFGIAVDKMLALRGEDKPSIGLTLNLMNVTGNQT